MYKAKLKGNDVAVKVLKNLKETKPLLTEGNLLRFVSLLSTPTTLPARGGGGDSHMKVTGMLVVSLRVVNCRFWSHLGC